jgi:hypothetical protein
MIKSRRMIWTQHRALPRKRAEMHAYKILAGNPGGKIPIGRPRSRWEDNIIMDLRELACGGKDYIHLDRVQTSGWLL